MRSRKSLGRRLVHGLGNGIDDDAVGDARMLDRAKAVEHVVEDLCRGPLQRLAEAAAAWRIEYMHVARRHAHARELRRHVLDLVRRATL